MQRYVSFQILPFPFDHQVSEKTCVFRLPLPPPSILSVTLYKTNHAWKQWIAAAEWWIKKQPSCAFQDFRRRSFRKNGTIPVIVWISVTISLTRHRQRQETWQHLTRLSEWIALSYPPVHWRTFPSETNEHRFSTGTVAPTCYAFIFFLVNLFLNLSLCPPNQLLCLNISICVLSWLWKVREVPLVMTDCRCTPRPLPVFKCRK